MNYFRALALLGAIILFGVGAAFPPEAFSVNNYNVLDNPQTGMQSGTTLPSTCSIGQTFFKTNAAAGANIYGCTAANTWTAEGSGAPGGSDTQVQYNSSGTFAGSANLTFTATPPLLDVGAGSGAAMGIRLGNAGSGQAQITTTNQAVGSNNGIYFGSDSTIFFFGRDHLWYNNAGAQKMNLSGVTAGKGLSIAAGTATTDVNAYSVTQTWDEGSTAFTAAKLNVTDSASAAASLLLDLQVAGSSKFSVKKDGTATLPTLAGTDSLSFKIQSGSDAYFYSYKNGGSYDLFTGLRVSGARPNFTMGAAEDTNISNPSAGVIAIGNGTAGNASGTLRVGSIASPTITNPAITVQALTDASSITWDMSNGNMATVTIGAAARTFATPVNMRAGGSASVKITYGLGGTVSSLAGVFKFAGAATPLFSNASGKVDLLTCSIFDGINLLCSAALDLR